MLYFPERFGRWWRRFAVALAILASTDCRAADPQTAANDFFEKEVRPLLVERCQKCHSGKKPKGGLSLLSRAAILSGGDTGPAAEPGKADDSLLVRAVRYLDEPHMPPDRKLSERETETIARWVREGLVWPEAAPAAAATQPPFRVTAEQRRFWSFQPIRPAAPPSVRNRAWIQSRIDAFILARLEQEGLKPAPPADRRTLLRRVTFDLTGLPPTPAEIDAFLADCSATAFANVVDRLLASPRYGERWARHWLDVVRYTDSFDARGAGAENEMDIGEAWRYRDWVVDAFNRDLPYDQFMLHQLAGDLVVQAGGGADPTPLVATGMLAIGNWGGGDADKEKLLTDIADDQVDVVGRTFLGLTVSCARCHDHKFDPIGTADYYGLAGIFFSTHILRDVGPKTNGPPMLRIPLETPSQAAARLAAEKRVVTMQQQLDRELGKRKQSFARSLLGQTEKYALAAWDAKRAADGSMTNVKSSANAERGLLPYAVRQWREALQPEAARPLMTQRIHDVLGAKNVEAWKGAADCPSLTLNRNAKEVSLLTFRLPPKSVVMHPGPKGGVALTWRSPINGVVRVSGRVADADSACGDGVAWDLVQQNDEGRKELASGSFANGGKERFSGAGRPERLSAVSMHVGDLLELHVLPKAEYSCDSTVVDFEIAAANGQSWNVAEDLLSAAERGAAANPFPDRKGNAAVWSCWDMADVLSRPPTSLAALASWRKTAASASRPGAEKEAKELQRTFTLDDSRSPFWIRDPADEKHLPAGDQKSLAYLREQLASLRHAATAPPTINGAMEGGVPGSPQAGVHDVRIHYRGRYDRLGDVAPRRFPIVVAGDAQPPIREGSGRLQLAQWLASPQNPLPARVMVNRLWQYHFGDGLVRTPSNFGKLGEKPSHPELLDHLAAEFLAGRWSIKEMHRKILLSATYQQASVGDPATQRADPDNRLFGRMNRRRLEAEAVRDNLLATTGDLDRTMGGRATSDFFSPRRTLYQTTNRSDRSTFRELFDAADSTAIIDKRTVSTVAPQALFLLNHPFVLQQATRMAKKIEKETSDDRRRIADLYVRLFGRPPTAAETNVGLQSIALGWDAYCQLLFCSNEFLYID